MNIPDNELRALLNGDKTIIEKYRNKLSPCPFTVGQKIWVSNDGDSWFERSFVEMSENGYKCFNNKTFNTFQWNEACLMVQFTPHDGQSEPGIENSYKFINLLYRDGSIHSTYSHIKPDWIWEDVITENQIIGYQVVR